jgi:hypothetical protein
VNRGAPGAAPAQILNGSGTRWPAGAWPRHAPGNAVHAGQGPQHGFGIVGTHARAQPHVGELERMCSASSRVMTLPISTSPPPLGYLVSACTEISTPNAGLAPGTRSNGANARPAPQVLSSAVTTPRALHRRTSSARSGNSSVTEPARFQPHQTRFVADFGGQVLRAHGIVKTVGNAPGFEFAGGQHLVGAVRVVGDQHLVAGFQQRERNQRNGRQPAGHQQALQPPSSVHNRSSSMYVVGVPCRP